MTDNLEQKTEGKNPLIKVVTLGLNSTIEMITIANFIDGIEEPRLGIVEHSELIEGRGGPAWVSIKDMNVLGQKYDVRVDCFGGLGMDYWERELMKKSPDITLIGDILHYDTPNWLRDSLGDIATKAGAKIIKKYYWTDPSEELIDALNQYHKNLTGERK